MPHKIQGNRDLAHFLRKFLFPFSLLYGAIIVARNLFFDWGWNPSRSFDLPIVSLGNITVGGTGKTPHAEYLIRLLQPKYHITLISRGYRRKTKGVVVATPHSLAIEIGDEPKQMLDKHPGLNVVVAEKRVLGIERALSLKPLSDVIVMDDAYQHRHVKPGFSILLMDFARPLWRDCMLPAGDLREPANGKKRADIIVVTKCPGNLLKADADIIIKKLKPLQKQQVYFSTFCYGHTVSFVGRRCEIPMSANVLAITGIARPEPFFNHLAECGYHVTPMPFADHHHFSSQDVVEIKKQFDLLPIEKRCIVTTEKDAVRLREIPAVAEMLGQYIVIIPIEVAFLFSEQEKFNHQIIEYVSKNQRNL